MKPNPAPQPSTPATGLSRPVSAAQAAFVACSLSWTASAQNFDVTGVIEAGAQGFENTLLIADDFATNTQLGASAHAPLAVPGDHLPSFMNEPVGRSQITWLSPAFISLETEASGLFFVPSNLYDINGTASWQATVENQNPGQQDFLLNLFVPAIELRLFDAVGDPGLIWSAGYEIDIQVNGSSVWSSGAVITGNMFNVSLATSGTTALAATPVDLPPPDKPAQLIGYDFGPHAETVFLQTLNTFGETFDLDVFVASFISDVPDVETGAYSIIGNPAHPFPEGVELQIVPEPGLSALLAGAGAILLLAWRQRGMRRTS